MTSELQFISYPLKFPFLYIFALLGNIFNVVIASEAKIKDTFLNDSLIWYYVSFGVYCILAYADYYDNTHSDYIGLTFNIFTGITLTIMFINHVIGFVIYNKQKYSLNISPNKAVHAGAILNYILFFGLMILGFIILGIKFFQTGF